MLSVSNERAESNFKSQKHLQWQKLNRSKEAKTKGSEQEGNYKPRKWVAFLSLSCNLIRRQSPTSKTGYMLPKLWQEKVDRRYIITPSFQEYFPTKCLSRPVY